jgi:hypothetical protein
VLNGPFVCRLTITRIIHQDKQIGNCSVAMGI